MRVEKGSECLMTVAYLKDVSALLALLSADGEGAFERNLQSEREILKHCFALDHVNYARCLSYQHVLLQELQRQNYSSINDLEITGFGRSLSGNAFSTSHGDLITEFFNGEMKRSTGSCIAGYSTEVDKVNAWIKTSHINAKIQNVSRGNTNITTSALHKE